MCKILKVYELRGSKYKFLWEMIETRVTAGNTASPFCDGVEAEFNRPTIWSWQHPHEYELPFDFMSHDLMLPH